MLKNKKTVYFCQECGYESSKWMGQCPGCKAWNTFVEETVSTKKSSSSGSSSFQNPGKRPEPVRLKDISLSEDERRLTKIGELDRVLGGGIVPGSLVLVGGDPGIGKSTLLYRCAGILHYQEVMYCIFQERNPCARSSSAQNESENLMRSCSFCVRQIWKRSAK